MIDFGEIEPGAYDFIMADPPWHFRSWSVTRQKKATFNKYSVMDLESIKAIPVRDYAAADCLLWLWALGSMVPQALQVVDAWGFEYSTMGWWAKTTTGGKQAFGMGKRLRDAGEPFIIATRGQPKSTRGVRNTILGLRREHSRKPESAYKEAERLMPDARRLDMFSRQTRAGWDAWGYERGLYDDEPLRCF